MFLPFKHSLLDLSYIEFKDLLYAPFNWFQRVNSIDQNLKYPTVTWDFLYSGGASQVHPHCKY